MLRFDKSSKRRILWCKKTINIWDFDDIIISNFTDTKNNSKSLIEYLDEVIRPLVLILPKMCGYVKTFKDKDGDKDKNDKFMSLCINDEKLSEKYKAIWAMIEDLKNMKLNVLPIYDIYIHTYIYIYNYQNKDIW